MPYGDIKDPERVAKMERCVQGLMSEGKDKESAIAICYTSIAGDSNNTESTLTSTTGTYTLDLSKVTSVGMISGWNVNEGVQWSRPGPADYEYVHSMLASEDGELLKFTGARLCLSGRNANGDGISDEGLHELASTLSLMALDDEHISNKVIGFFINPRVENSALYTDGLVYARRFPEISRDIISGAKKLSIEANAMKASCSECNKVFDRPSEYCEHLRGRPANGATRWLSGLKAIGGGATYTPAYNTAFDENGFTMIASLSNVSVPDQQVSASNTQQEADMPNIEELQATLEQVRAELAAKVENLATVEARVSELEAALSERETALQEALTEVQSTQASLQAERVGFSRSLDMLDAGFNRDEVSQMEAALRVADESLINVLKATKQSVATEPTNKVQATAIGDSAKQVVVTEMDELAQIFGAK